MPVEQTFTLANSHQQRGNFQEALKGYQNILRINSSYPEAHNNLGKVYQELGQSEEAIICYQNAIRINADYADAHYNLGNLYQSLGEYQQALFFYSAVIQINPDCAEGHNNLGKIYQELGQSEEAIICYQNAIRINADYINAHYNLGNLYRSLSECQQAIAWYQATLDLCDGALALNPSDDQVYTLRQNAVHLLSSQIGVTTKTAPKHYIQSLFDDYAARFDHHLAEVLDYKVPKLLKNILLGLQSKNVNIDVAIDLGCGTGLSGEAFRPLCKKLVGIDLSPKMLEIAKKKEVYDVIENIDLNKYLNNDLEKYDLFIATDVLIYIGDLSQLFSNISGASKSGAVFLFSTESTNTNDYLLTNQGRYAHSDKYVNQLARLHQFTILKVENTILRTEEGKGVDGQLFILKYLG